MKCGGRNSEVGIAAAVVEEEEEGSLGLVEGRLAAVEVDRIERFLADRVELKMAEARIAAGLRDLIR